MDVDIIAAEPLMDRALLQGSASSGRMSANGGEQAER